MMDSKQHTLIWWVWGGLTIALPAAIAALLWSKLPAEIPIHWNIHGKPDSYAAKEVSIALFMGINIVSYGLLFLLPKIDPKKNFEQFKTAFRWVIFSSTTLIAAITSLIIIHSAGVQFHLFKAILTLILLLFLVLGNFMGKLRPNYFVGIRTPWTIENEDVWVKTHRLGGQVWVVTALISLVMLYGVQSPMWVFMTGILIMVLVPTVYSYILHKQLKEH
ncbi:SdpI family protein [uncultured Microscilla sp.]|uniref:SdpI family protein n=1 Tax=uncultured Microscilla sp. TaxID=432653 RepID=UPI00260AB734|nr:SdpI family protein [uncultured Microscilla sp.]